MYSSCSILTLNLYTVQNFLLVFILETPTFVSAFNKMKDLCQDSVIIWLLDDTGVTEELCITEKIRVLRLITPWMIWSKGRTLSHYKVTVSFKGCRRSPYFVKLTEREPYSRYRFLKYLSFIQDKKLTVYSHKGSHEVPCDLSSLWVVSGLRPRSTRGCEWYTGRASKFLWGSEALPDVLLRQDETNWVTKKGKPVNYGGL